jgi:hypothetical protein
MARRRRRPDEWEKFDKAEAGALLEYVQLRRELLADRPNGGGYVAAGIRQHAELRRDLEHALDAEAAREARDQWRDLERAYREMP